MSFPHPRSRPAGIVSQDVSVVALVAADMLAGKPTNERDWNDPAQAANRIARARDQMRQSGCKNAGRRG